LAFLPHSATTQVSHFNRLCVHGRRWGLRSQEVDRDSLVPDGSLVTRRSEMVPHARPNTRILTRSASFEVAHQFRLDGSDGVATGFSHGCKPVDCSQQGRAVPKGRHVSVLRGLCRPFGTESHSFIPVHGLTPVAVTCCPFGTHSLSETWRPLKRNPAPTSSGKISHENLARL
jgi:hypothetical protein